VGIKGSVSVFRGKRALSAGSSLTAQSGRFLVVFQNRNVTNLVLGSLLQRKALQKSTMNLSSVNVDVLLYLMKFVHPDDRFNLALSGVLKGFENINRGIDLDKRYSKHLSFVSSCKRIVI
jgi:hypothetical protein